MSSEGLSKAVLERARAEAQQIVAAAKKDAEASQKAAADRAERDAGDVLDRARRAAAEARSRERSSLEREMRLKALEQKNLLLERVFTDAAARFRSLPADELRSLYRGELEGVKLEGATLRVPAGGSGLFGEAQSRGARLQEDQAIDGGYVVEGADFRLDRTLAARIADLRATLRGELAQVLFGAPE
jgi:vacuolar-type H+-ATPase subunit E/Vma4